MSKRNTDSFIDNEEAAIGLLYGSPVHGVAGLGATGQLHFHFSLSWIGEGNGNPFQCTCLENPRDGGAWWAVVNGVAQSRTLLKRLSSSSSSPPAPRPQTSWQCWLPLISPVANQKYVYELIMPSLNITIKFITISFRSGSLEINLVSRYRGRIHLQKEYPRAQGHPLMLGYVNWGLGVVNCLAYLCLAMGHLFPLWQNVYIVLQK